MCALLLVHRALLQLAVHYMGAIAEALLQLPEVPLRSAAAAAASDAGPGSSSSNSSAPAAPAALWLTVGLLAADGFALQLRLRLADKVRATAVCACMRCVLLWL